jgi:hypothetical protein
MRKDTQGSTQYAVAQLPFTVKVVSNEDELAKATSLRQAAYARHLPEVARGLGTPEAMDFQPDTDVLLAQARLDGAPLGTMRIHRNDSQPLPLEQSFRLPAQMRTARLAEATRFGMGTGEQALAVKTALFKALYLYGVQHDIDYIVITARYPLDRMYERLLYEDVEPEAGYIPMKHVGNIPHRVLYFPVARAEEIYVNAKHPLLDYAFRTVHPDIELPSPLLTQNAPAVTAESDVSDESDVATA